MYPFDQTLQRLSTSKHEFVNNLITNLKLIHDIHRENFEVDRLRMKERHDSKVSVCSFKINDLVWLKDEFSQGTVRRFQRHFIGPYLVLTFVEQGYTVTLKNLTNGKILRNKVYVNLLKPYNSSLSVTEKRHLLMENEEGVENEPSGKNLDTRTVDVQTEVSFFDLMLGGRIEPSKGVVQYPTPLPLASVEHSPLSSPPISLSPPPVSIPSSPLPVQAPSLPSPVGGSQSL